MPIADRDFTLPKEFELTTGVRLPQPGSHRFTDALISGYRDRTEAYIDFRRRYDLRLRYRRHQSSSHLAVKSARFGAIASSYGKRTAPESLENRRLAASSLSCVSASAPSLVRANRDLYPHAPKQCPEHDIRHT